MKQQKYYNFLNKQILLMIGLSLIPGLVYVFFGWLFDIALPAVLWYAFLVLLSFYGWYLYREFLSHKMNEEHLRHWYSKLIGFMYVMFSSWSIIFVLYVDQSDNNLHYIAIFTQLGASVVASTLLVSDKKLFVPILLTLMLPLSIYFFLIGAWYGYVLFVFSLIFLFVLLYASFNTNRLLEENYFNAQHDVLTGLYNRRYFLDYMESLNERLEEGNEIANIYLIDLDHFKTINDSLGHDIGDKLLIEVSKRLASFVDDKYMLARLGGDEFILVSKDTVKSKTNKDEAYNFAMSVLDIIRNPYSIDKHQLHISASIGLHQLRPSSLYDKNFIKSVDIAMYEAKMQGRDGVMVFNKELEDKVERHLRIEQKLHHAIAEDIIEIYYQPQFDKNSNLKGCEALLRWKDKELGSISPNEFIPISENTGLVLELGSYVLKHTFEVLHQWNKTDNTLKYFSINISMRQLLNEMFLDEVTYLMQHYFHNVELKQEIVFEITETVFASDIKKVILIMNQLKKLGICFSIDDFGTGYSSLSYLRELPIGEVKIDKAFISNMKNSSNDENMISTIITIAKNFDLNTVAEGVETEEQFNFLAKHNCDMFQGFYFDKVLPQNEFEEKYIT